VLRVFNVAGAVAGRTDHDTTRIIPAALAVASGARPELTVNGDGSAIRDFVHVDDVAAAFVAAIETDSTVGGATFNVGATGASVSQIIEVVEQVTGRSLPVNRQAPKPEPERLLADTTRIRANLGWTPQRSSLPEIISDAWAATTKA
jgi:UDP-glucose 4-epimerase